jgi:predicted ATPase/DNA-binding XRE family transcriptional regulator
MTGSNRNAVDVIYSFGEWMKRRRKASDLTQRELADLAHCSVVTIKKIEADRRRPSRDLARSLANALAIPEEQQAIFIECARGQRPVDHLARVRESEGAQSKTPPFQAIVPHPLPVATTPFIGRESELAMLQSLLEKSWLVTIVGVGGIGKTRLALAAAADRRDDGHMIAFVSLAELTTGDDLAAVVVEALGLQLTADSDPTIQLLDYLRQRTMLLVMDNFEHLLEKAPLLAQMHQAAPGLTLMVTSREPLRLPGEQLLPLEGLPYPHDRREMSKTADANGITQYAAIQLFLDHARRLLPDFTPDNENALIQLSRITDGLPLALELAAAWVDSLTLPDLVQTLARSLDLLTLNEPGRPARHYSMRAAFDTSWQLLDHFEQEAFARLAIFQGGFTRQAAKEIADISLPQLSDLVGRHLVRLDHKRGRYTLHELMRQYGAEKLADLSKIEDEIRQRHARFFCEFLAHREADLKNAKQKETLSEIRADRANIWVAWQWAAQHPHHVSLADAVAPLGIACQLRGWIEDGYNLFTQTDQALAKYRDQPGDLLCLLHLNVWRCWFALWLGHPMEEMLGNIQRMLAAIPPSPALQPILALYHLVAEEAFLDAGKRDLARDHGDQALGLYKGLDDAWGQANALTQLGTVCWNVGHYAEAQRYIEESLALRRQIGDRLGEAISLDRLGLLLMHQGQLELSNHHLEQAVDLFSQLGERFRLADALENMGSNWLEMGQLNDARRKYAETDALFNELGLRHLGVTVLKALTAYASVHMGKYEQADREGKTAVALSREYGHTRSEGLALITLGMAAVALGDEMAAAGHLDAGTDHLRAINQLEELSQGIGVQALIAYRQEDLEKAHQLALTALTISTELRGLASTPDYALSALALLLAHDGDDEQAASVYQLVLAEPFGAASRWFADLCGRFIPYSPPAGFMLPEERWAAIEQLSRSFFASNKNTFTEPSKPT